MLRRLILGRISSAEKDLGVNKRNCGPETLPAVGDSRSGH